MIRRFLVAAACLTTPAAAQIDANGYRTGQPEVMTPRPVRPAGEARTEAFRSAYARARSPRVIVFWNRQLDDELSTGYRDTVRIDQNVGVTASSQETAQVGWNSSRRDSSADMTGHSSTELSAGTQRDRAPQRRAAMGEADDWGVESGFNRTLAEAGVRLIDRVALMRTSALGRSMGAKPNLQAFETGVLAGKTDLLVEILQTADDRGPMGAVFRITVRDVRSARLLASVTSSGVPAPAPTRWVAGARGYERAAPRQGAGPDEVGRKLALDMMAALMPSLS